LLPKYLIHVEENVGEYSMRSEDKIDEEEYWSDFFKDSALVLK